MTFLLYLYNLVLRSGNRSLSKSHNELTKLWCVESLPVCPWSRSERVVPSTTNIGGDGEMSCTVKHHHLNILLYTYRPTRCRSFTKKPRSIRWPIKTCHFIFDYNWSVSWSIFFTTFAPFETEISTWQRSYKMFHFAVTVAAHYAVKLKTTQKTADRFCSAFCWVGCSKFLPENPLMFI